MCDACRERRQLSERKETKKKPLLCQCIACCFTARLLYCATPRSIHKTIGVVLHATDHNLGSETLSCLYLANVLNRNDVKYAAKCEIEQNSLVFCVLSAAYN